ncbi:hypothetical protein C8Q70DRAFT_75804 [Cubamyces menziesii]|nr:hypothetical protein C8Q70DRAFT_75804 [Cubamyces menziesii]
MPGTRPLVVLICLDFYELFQRVHAHLLSALQARSEICFAKTKSEALTYLTSTTRPNAVVVCDAAVSHPEYVDVLHHLVQYVQSGGTAVFAGAFSSFVRFWSLQSMFECAWGLPWRLGTYHSADYALNPRVKGLNIKELPKKYSMKAVTLAGVAPKALLYAEPRFLRKLSRGKDSSASKPTLEASVAFTKIGKGRLGYMGDVNGEVSTTAVVLAMCFHWSSHAPIAPGSGVLALPPRSVLIVSLEKAPFMDEQYEQLYRAVRRNAMLVEVQNEHAAIEALSATPPPSSVLVSDGAITHSKHSRLLDRLVDFARAGGRVVLGVHFSNTISPANGKPFFRKWGLNWDYGEYHRTTFQLNPRGVPPPLNEEALFPSMSAKAVHLRNVPVEDAVYLPASDARVQSHVFAATPITGSRAQQTPGAFTRVSAGYLGYIGDVNAEHESIRLTIEMLGVPINPGDLGPKTVITGMSFRPGGHREVSTSIEEEIPLPTWRAQIAQQTQVVQPRPRELEVTARSEQRARTRAEKQAHGDALKDEGNILFRREQWVEAAVKYHAAAFAVGPQPAYMTNLAAALLKLNLWEIADSAASRALVQEPTNVKALYRRALARKGLSRFAAAEADLQRLLQLDRSNQMARSELTAVRQAKAKECSYDWPGDESLKDNKNATAEEPLELEEESDSEDFKHMPNASPCKAYNHDGCPQGTNCRFRHGPDGKSVRDELGRNVCIYWLVGECRFGDDRCVYAHDKTYLPKHGWWTKTQRLNRICKEFEDAVLAAPRLGVSEKILAEALKPVPWRLDMWAYGGYAEAAMIQADRDAADKEAEEVFAQFRAAHPSSGPVGEDEREALAEEWPEDEDGDELSPWERDVDESGENYGGHTEADYHEMLMYGIKPWDADAMDDLEAIRRAMNNL